MLANLNKLKHTDNHIDHVITYISTHVCMYAKKPTQSFFQDFKNISKVYTLHEVTKQTYKNPNFHMHSNQPQIPWQTAFNLKSLALTSQILIWL